MRKAMEIAAISAISLLMLVWAGCGLLLNHATTLELDRIRLFQPWLMTHYQATDVQVDEAWLLADQLFTAIDDKLYINAQPRLRVNRALSGGIVLDEIIVLATDDNLLLFDIRGEYIGLLGAAEQIPAEIQNIGLHHGLPVLQTRSGMWRGNIVLDEWELVSLQGVSWSEVVPLPETTRDALRQLFATHGVKLSDLLTDLYSGQFFGEQGRWLADGVILLMLVLAFRGMFGISGKS